MLEGETGSAFLCVFVLLRSLCSSDGALFGLSEVVRESIQTRSC